VPPRARLDSGGGGHRPGRWSAHRAVSHQSSGCLSLREFTVREVYRNDWTGLTEPRVVGEALECLRELGWIRPEAAIARDGGRPTVRFHINPRVASL
jgi:hypothetical protein